MAKFFGKKQQAGAAQGSTDGKAQAAIEATAGGFQHDPEKATRWFEHAKTVHETSNYEYATTCWLKGLAFDPMNQEALEECFRSAQAFAASQKKPGPSKEQLNNFESKTPIGKYITGLLQTSTRPVDTAMAVKSVAAAAVVRLRDPAKWLGERAIRIAGREGKIKKDPFVKLKDILVELDIFDIATKAGEIAVRIDPSDSSLDDEVRNLSAQAAMHSGGFDEAGEEGGFRKNLRNADAQQKNQERENIVRSEAATETLIEETKADYEERPDDPYAAAKYARVLLERGKLDDEKTAEAVLLKAYESSREFRYRQQVGDIRIRRGRRVLNRLKKAIEAAPKDKAIREQFSAEQRKHLELEAGEFQLRVEAYPTDRGMKYELGRRLYHLEQYEDAIAALQEAQHDAKHRVRTLNYLAMSFGALDWNAEAVGMFRSAIESHASETDDLGMELRYGLMGALRSKAEQDKEAASAEEALKIASALAMQQINYRDVRQQREQLQALSQELRGS